MTKQEFLKSLGDVYCRLAPTARGVGVVAIRNIPKDVDPFKNCYNQKEYLEIPADELEHFPCDEAVKNMVRDFCALQDGIYFAPDNGIDAIDKGYFVNHSKTPNLVANDGEKFIAARDIEAGEELTADYDSYNDASVTSEYTLP